jgi:uncharacterized protein
MDKKFRILSMDGGNGLNTAELLTQLENVQHKRFLDDAAVFAGTSAGGINSLYFAAAANPTDALADIKTFWNQVNVSILEGLSSPTVQHAIQQSHAAGAAALAQMNTPPAGHPSDIGTFIRTAAGVSMAALGFRSLFLNDAMKALLLQRFGDMRLKDLKKKVVIVSFQLDKQIASVSSNERSWAPKLYTNLKRTLSVPHGTVTQDPNLDLEELVVDVAMRTSAAPLELPIYQSFYGVPGLSGFVDGGLVANNPSMITLAAIIGSIMNPQANTGGRASGDLLDLLLVLSVGTGRNLVGTAQYLDPEFDNGSAAWGYQKWLIDPSNLLVLVDAFLQGGNESAAFQCRVLLNENFNRLNVPIKDFLVPDDPRTREAVARSARWLEQKGGWLAAPLTTDTTASLPETPRLAAARQELAELLEE